MARILYVEDHPVDRMIMGEHLNQEGYQVEFVKYASAGALQAHLARPELIDWKERISRRIKIEK